MGVHDGCSGSFETGQATVDKVRAMSFRGYLQWMREHFPDGNIWIPLSRMWNGIRSCSMPCLWPCKRGKCRKKLL